MKPRRTAKDECRMPNQGLRFSRRQWLTATAALGCAAAGSTLMPRSASAAENAQEDATAIGSRRELFVDSLLIEKLDGVRLKLHEPRPAGVAVRRATP